MRGRDGDLLHRFRLEERKGRRWGEICSRAMHLVFWLNGSSYCSWIFFLKGVEEEEKLRQPWFWNGSSQKFEV